MSAPRFKAFAILLACVPGLATVGYTTQAGASDIVAMVNLSRQRMEVAVDGVKKFAWRVSTGKDGWRTPSGTYQPFALTPYYYSKKWHMALPYLVSIGEDGTAIHGTSYTSKLGSPASHGCIRLDAGNAATFYRLVEANGMTNTKVIVTR